MTSKSPQKVSVSGACHCGAVRYEARLPRNVRAQRCNCSICQMTGFVHVIVPARDFSLIQGKQQLSEYRFNTGQARHLFCSVCGVKSYYVPRSNPDGYSLNLSCLDTRALASVEIEDFDGQNWEQNGATLRHLSE